MPVSSTFRTVLRAGLALSQPPADTDRGPSCLGPRYYFGKLKDPLEELVPSSTDAVRSTGAEPFAGGEPFAGTPTEPGPAAASLPFATDASTMTVRQPRTSQEPSTTQVTSPRPATAPEGMVAGSTPPCQGTPLPHQVEVQASVAP